MSNKNIGGDFSLLSILPFVGSKEDFFPESIGDNKCSFFETGTDAICALILAHWEHNNKINYCIWFPIHYCGQTILRIKQVLYNYGCALKFSYYEQHADLKDYNFDKGDIIIWVHFNCFSPLQTFTTEHLKNKGVFILEDFVLAPFDINELTGNAAVNSLRKITPLSLSMVYSKYSFPDYKFSPAYSDERRIAAWQKSVFEMDSKAALEVTFLERFHNAERILNKRLTIQIASKEDEVLLKIIDWSKILETRKRNYSLLLAKLHSLNLDVLPGEYQFLMLSLSERDNVRKALFVENVFSPIHWADAQSKLSKTQLSIPIDQRYSEPEMLHLAELLKKIIKINAT